MSTLYEKSFTKLELDQVLVQLAECASSALGKQACLHGITGLMAVPLQDGDIRCGRAAVVLPHLVPHKVLSQQQILDSCILQPLQEFRE